MPTVNATVSHANHDAGNSELDDNFSSVMITVRASSLVYNRYGCGFIFVLNVAKGAAITSATFTGRTTSAGGVGDDLHGRIYCEAVDDAVDFATNNALYARPVTGSGVAWDAPDTGYDVDITSPNFASELQGVVDRAGWASGNKCCIIIKGNSQGTYETIRFVEYETSTQYCGRLSVTYTSGGQTYSEEISLGASAAKSLAGSLVLERELSLHSQAAMNWLTNLIIDAGVSLQNSAAYVSSGGMNFAEAIALVTSAAEGVAPYLTISPALELEANAALAAAAQHELLAQLGLGTGAGEQFNATGVWDRAFNLPAEAGMSQAAGFILQAQLLLNAASLVNFDRFLAIFKETILGASAGQEVRETLVADALVSMGVRAEQLQAAFNTISVGIGLAAQALLQQSGAIQGVPPLPDIIVAALKGLTDPHRVRPEVEEWRVTSLDDPGRIKKQ